mgnify:CR=1 FL=1
MNDGWEYLEQFNMGVLEATGRKTTLNHVLVNIQHDGSRKTIQCFINGTAEPEMLKDLPLKTEFMVRLKCVDKEAGVYLSAKGRACVKEVGHGPEGLQAHFEIKISAIAAYSKQTDENGIDSLQPLYNDLPNREDRKAKLLTHYAKP